MRLSQRAWNNVIIFAMLVMILLFNLSDIFRSGPDTERQVVPLLPEHSLIMSIEYDGIKIERIGQSWRQTPGSQTAVRLQDIIASWQSASIQALPASPSVSDDTPLVVVVWLAGESQGQVFEFFQQGESTLVRHQRVWYQLLSPNLEQLINA